MTMTTILRPDGSPWSLVACTTTDPPWVGWVHDAAAGWANEVIRLRDAGRAAGVEGGATPDLWAAQRQYTRDLTAAIGNLARALNTPIPSFRPWAEELLTNDVGSSPWVGWGFTSPGEWRFTLLERIESHDSRVHDAVASGNAILDQLGYRVGLSVDGRLSTDYLDGLAPTQPGGHDLDYHQSDCGPVGGAPTGWDCVDWAVWYPGAADADRFTWINCIVPLGLHWQMAAHAVDVIESLGTLERLVSESRAWCNKMNGHAVDYMHDELGLPVAMPEDILTQQAADMAARLQVPRSAVVTRMLGASVASAITNPAVAAVVAIATMLPEILYEIFGQAQAVATDVWGRRDPAVYESSLTGLIDLRHPRPPTHSVAQPPAGSGTSLPGHTSDVRTLYQRRMAARNAGQRAPSVQPIRTQAQLDRLTRSPRSTGGPSKKSGSAAVLGLAALALLLAK